MHADYTGQGFDQLSDVIDKIKNRPDDRRIILSAWNPSDLKLMALPPCHMFAQVTCYFYLIFICLLFYYDKSSTLMFIFLAVLCSQWGAILPNVSAVC
jgi:hypothetical protein